MKVVKELQKKEFVRIEINLFEDIISKLKQSFSMYAVLGLALEQGKDYKDGLTADILEGFSQIAFSAEEQLGMASIEAEKILKEYVEKKNCSKNGGVAWGK